MLSRTTVILSVAAWAFMACSPEEKVVVEPEETNAADDDAPADDDTSVPGFNNEDDDTPPADTSDDDVATMDDDVAAPPASGGAPSEPPADDDVTTPPDDVPADDDVVPVEPSGDDDVAMPVDPGGIGSVGSACENDGDCASGLSCLNESAPYFGGVYPNGMCSADCSLDPFICDSLGGACIGTETEAWCLPLCPTGGTGIKCRADQTCVNVDAEALIGVCDAMCRDDLDCPEGLECEPTIGLCVEMAHTGIALGEACSVDDPEACAGRICLPATPDGTEGMCTQACNLTEDISACGVPRDAEPPWPGICDPVTSVVVSGLYLAPGDLGLCTSTCDLETGCLPGWTCSELYPEYQDAVGHEGVCVFSDLLEPAEPVEPVEPVDPVEPVGDAGAP